MQGNLAANLARKLAGCMVKDIARHFQREPMTISQGIIKVEQLIHNDIVLKKTLEAVERELTKEGKINYLITIA